MKSEINNSRFERAFTREEAETFIDTLCEKLANLNEKSEPLQFYYSGRIDPDDSDPEGSSELEIYWTGETKLHDSDAVRSAASQAVKGAIAALHGEVVWGSFSGTRNIDMVHPARACCIAIVRPQSRGNGLSVEVYRQGPARKPAVMKKMSREGWVLIDRKGELELQFFFCGAENWADKDGSPLTREEWRKRYRPNSHMTSALLTWEEPIRSAKKNAKKSAKKSAKVCHGS